MRARVAGHPLHPALVHFPIALWLAAVLWDLAGVGSRDPLLRQMSYWCLALGLAAALPTIVTGFVELLSIQPRHPALDVATAHMMTMLSATAAFGASWAIRAAAGAAAEPSFWALLLGFLGAGLVLAGGWLGGTLVYRHGIGREDER